MGMNKKFRKLLNEQLRDMTVGDIMETNVINRLHSRRKGREFCGSAGKDDDTGVHRAQRWRDHNGGIIWISTCVFVPCISVFSGCGDTGGSACYINHNLSLWCNGNGA